MSFEFNNPILYVKRDAPYPEISETVTIRDGKALLTEVPDQFNMVLISGYFEIASGTPLSNQFLVNYTNGIIQFNPSENQKNLMCSYFGTGYTAISADRIYTGTDENNNIIQTVQNLADSVTVVNELIATQLPVPDDTITDNKLSNASGQIKDKITTLNGIGDIKEKTNKSDFDTYKAENAALMLEKLTESDINTLLSKTDVQSVIGFADINKNLSQIDETMLEPELLAQIAGTAEINATPAPLGVLTGMVAEKAITKSKTAFFKQSAKNLLYIQDGAISANGVTVTSDGNKIIINGTATASFYINLSTLEASIGIVAGWLTPTIIPLSTGEMTFSETYISGSPSSTTPTLGLRNKSNTVFTSFTQATKKSTGIPTEDIAFCYAYIASGTVFVNLTFNLQVEKGVLATEFDQYFNVDISIFKPRSITNDLIAYNAISIASTDFFKQSLKNLLNPLTLTSGYISYLDGLPYSNPLDSYSDFMPVTQNTAYVNNKTSRMIAFFDSGKVFISGVQNITPNISYTTPPNTFYKQTTFINSELEIGIAQIEEGTSPTTPEPYYYLKTYNAPLATSTNSEEFLLFLPSEICVAVGRTIELYNKQVSWCGNIENYHFQWICLVGHNMKRKFSVKGTSGTIGEYALTLNVYDNNMSLVKSATSTVKIISNVLSVVKNVLTIGDSLTNTTSTPKPWMTEIRSLSSNKLNFVGTRGLAVGEMHEGRSGWSSLTYLTGTSYTFEGEGVNPFWDGTRFNWSYYKTHTGINPDAIQIWLGTNGITLDPTSNANNIKQMVDYIRQDDATIPISIVFTLFRGNQDGLGVQTGTDGYAVNQGAWELEEDRKVFNLMSRLYTLLSGYTKLYFTPVALEMDRDYNFGQTVTLVNPRATQTELLPVEATHPQTQGFLQIADTQFSVYAKHYLD